MKHLLNNLSEEEKNSIREQHTDRIKIDTSRFKSLMESKLGDVKPLVEQRYLPQEDPINPNKPLPNTKPKNTPSRPTPTGIPKTNLKPSPATPEKDLKPLDFKPLDLDLNKYIGKTVNLYQEPENTTLLTTSTILKFERKPSSYNVIHITLKPETGSKDQSTTKIEFSCGNWGRFRVLEGREYFPSTYGYTDYVYNNNLESSLKKQFCSTSSGGTEVPKADFVSNQKPLGSIV
jgi:hypothetical protein